MMETGDGAPEMGTKIVGRGGRVGLAVVSDPHAIAASPRKITNAVRVLNCVIDI